MRSRARLCACSLHSGSQSSFFSFRREDLDLEGLSLGERKFDLRESLGGRLGSLGRELIRDLKMKGAGVYL